MLHHTDFLDALRLAPQDAIDLLDERAEAPGGECRGEAHRRAGVRLLVRHHNGAQVRYLVFTDRIWTGGVTALHGGYLHPGAAARITLDTPDAERSLEAGVIHCSHLRGRVHFIELAFAAPLGEADLRDIAALAPIPASASVGVDPAALAGSVLHVDHSEMDHRLLMHQMARTRVAVTRASSGAAAVAHLREAKVDAVLCGLDLGDTTGEELIPRLRAERYAGPVAVVTGVKDSSRLRAAMAAGACDVLLKPYQPERLFQSLGRMLATAARRPRAGAIAPAVLQRTARIDARTLRRAIGELPGAITARDYDLVESLCDRLREAAERLAVTDIAQGAAGVLDALRRSGSVVGAAPDLRALLDRCQTHLAA